MVSAGAIKDASYLWWTLRPSIHYPTLELRVADSCTKLDDTLAIAALYRCLVRMVVPEPKLNQGMTGASRAIVAENLWRAQRDGVGASFIDETSGREVPCATYLASLLDQLAADVSQLDCGPEVERTREIVASGSSADHQLKILAESQKTKIAARGAIIPVVDWIARVTAGS
jgi:carboxylate-amine ligase